MRTDNTGNGARLPLDGVRIIDLTRALSGPFCTLMLAGLGAQVIKVEDPVTGDFVRDNSPYIGPVGFHLARTDPLDISLGFLDRGRNKLSITLNLKSPKAGELFADLVRKADVVVENFSSGTADRLGVGYNVAQASNPKIVYASISGYGTGARDGSPAMDVTIQALSGLMLTSGQETDPPIFLGTPIADYVGGIFGAFATLAALRQAEQTGIGQRVEVSMLGALTSLVAGEASAEILGGLGESLRRNGSTKPRLAPFGIYPCRDGWIAIAAGQEKWTRAFFADVIGQPELLGDLRFSSRDLRVKHSSELNEIIVQWTRAQDRTEALRLLDAAGVPAEPVRTPEEAVRDPLLIDRGDVQQLHHPVLGPIEDLYGSGIPISFDGTFPVLDKPAPFIGQHNQAVYGDLLGYSEQKLTQLRREEAI